ncbi:phosphoglycerate mutase [Chloropicon primus]|uniref:phosphoglycerate mutase (2,3-diphosphoglycerate-independent) n=1 Tax=Chloropicon primus TaxID=1764295 RepID=A0A5B8MYJ5_9CHLO|nr:phosphoglycerate mutase [Chloropicon primus]UPR05084.1 phosphoglycerate mutase [Chloropicon primus]|mmetsp:Transcript_9166/g.26061  ORF Transcript_9166/g.26061 Transcript_9166/m.26061 type:complete len:563 (+) Transcript_9166:125-1813(+)|eukprot:QDZ25888.1 phosphoglycerate mutase [Chloropicon primus]
MADGLNCPEEFKLKPHSVLPRGKPCVVCILDGFGENKHKDQYNAVHSARTPNVDKLRANAQRCRFVQAHGTWVGLPSDDDMGNSEVGHNAIGSGKVYKQGASLVDAALESGDLFKGDGFNHVKQAFVAGGTLHLIGLLSNGGVHARYEQLKQLFRGSFEAGAKRIRLHVLTDGRDVPDGTSIEFVGQLEKDLEDLRAKGCDALIASGGGRMHVTMDRYEADWGIVERGWKAHVLGEAPHKFTSAVEAVTELRKLPKANDQFLEPFVIVDEKTGDAVGTIQDNDAVVLFNYRSDRMVEISKAFEYENFTSFDRVRYPKNLKFAGMLQYDGDLKLPANYLVPPPFIEKTSGEYMVKNGLSIFACSETQKFGHVTFFWNGNRSGYFDEKRETYVEIPSDKCPFNEKPDMKTREITEAGIAALKSGRYDLLRINYASPDMVGHTGSLEATIRACETCDKCLGELLAEVDKLGGVYLVCSDHGNADDMVQRNKKTGQPLTDADGNNMALTSHTLAPVMVAVGGAGLKDSVKMREDLPKAGIASITATFINLCGYEAPSDYEPTLIDA